MPKKAFDWEITSILLGRPISAFILYPFRNFIHPNIITLVSFLFAITGTTILLYGGNIFSAVIFLFFSMILDDGDGLLARYQGKSSLFGSYLDKAVDVIRFIYLFNTLSFIAYTQTGSFIYAISGGIASCGLLIQGYTKWLNEHMLLSKNSGHEEENDGERSSSLHGLIKAILWPFNECDLTIWIVILLLFDRSDILVLILGVSQIAAAVGALVARGIGAWNLDKT